MKKVIPVLLLLACGGPAPPGIVSFGELEISGQVDTNQLLAQMRQLDPRFEACYARAKRDDHGVEGMIELHMQGGGGRLVPEVRSNDTGSDFLAECVTGAINGLTLVESGDETPWDFEIDWALTFTIATRERPS